MKKIFTTTLAVIAAISMSAQTYKMEMRVWVDGTVEYSKDLSKVDSITFVKKIVDPGTVISNFTPKAFTVSAGGKKVYFSQGNLQAAYDGSKWNWFFATNQWDYVGAAAANTSITGNGTVSVNDTVDLFGWSTKETYYGINNSTSNSTYSGKFEDWGNNLAGGWYTLSKDGWVYLFHGRDKADELFGLGSVNGVNGVIILPDDWVLPDGATFNNAKDKNLVWQSVVMVDYYSNSKEDNFSHNTYTAEQWSKMEKAGAVFLPAAGDRYGTDVDYVGSGGGYWSASPGDEGDACGMAFDSGSLGPQLSGGRGYGQSVRLVQEVK